jgi:signal transduction histidine kinase
MNLLSNAIDALGDRWAQEGAGFAPQLQITTHLSQPDRVQIAIQDNGLGIPEALQSKIFEPFYTTKPIGQGTGLGLAISYQIVQEQHQGSLRCHSTHQEGTTFTIEIPI